MKYKNITTKEEYQDAVKTLEEIGDRPDFEENEELITNFDTLSKLVDNYEKGEFSINRGEPLEIIKLKMAYLGIKQKDLTPRIGTSGVVSEVFNKKRGLSKRMIRELANLLHIDQEILNVKYELHGKLLAKVRYQSSNIRFRFIEDMAQNVSAFKKQIKRNNMVFNVNAFQ